jgi:hypothetical protein
VPYDAWASETIGPMSNTLWQFQCGNYHVGMPRPDGLKLFGSFESWVAIALLKSIERSAHEVPDPKRNSG